MDPKGVFFDLYGTLLVFGDLGRAWEGWFEVLHRHLGAMGLDLSRPDLQRRCDGFFGRPEPPAADDGLTIFERRFRAFCQELGLCPRPDDLSVLADAAVRAWQEHVHPDPHAEAVLAAVGARRRLALISNFDHPRHVHGLLAEWGIRGYFDSVVVSGEVGTSKPDPRIFEIALKETGLLAAEAIHVGDSAEDVHGARRAGLVPVLIRRPRPDDQPILLDYRVEPGAGAPAGDLGAVLTVSSLPALLEFLD